MKTVTKITATILAAIMLMSMVPIFNVNAGATFEYTRSNTGNLRDDLVAVAQSQVGYIEESYNHTKFGRVYMARLNRDCDDVVTDTRMRDYDYGWLTERCTVHFADEREQRMN